MVTLSFNSQITLNKPSTMVCSSNHHVSINTSSTIPSNKNRMKSAFLSLLLLSSWIAIPRSDGTKQADRLQEFINFQRPMETLSGNSWRKLDIRKSSSQVYVGNQDGFMEADKIRQLPGQPKGVNFNQYSGYVTVDHESGRALFYYFAESPKDTASKPLVLWLNGGPGCSSLGYGAMEELGPFRVNSDGVTLQRNEYSWNNVANVIFLESPAGVGFSYSNSTSDYNYNGDKRAADDSYTFLVNWLERFPQYKKRDFFITGESYAGHYVPDLANTILLHNKNGSQTAIRLKGIAIGNPYLEQGTNTMGQYDYLWAHALNSDETYALIQTHCNFTNSSFPEECNDAFHKSDFESGNIDFYNIYAPLCHTNFKAAASFGSITQFDPCTSSYVYTYLNNAEVQRVLHANNTKLPYPWNSCRPIIWTDRAVTMLPVVKQLITEGITVWLYSGDLDVVCPFPSTKYFIKKLGLPIEEPWRPWYTNEEVGGYVVAYKGLTFVTVRGAGHEVPSYQPERALTMISSFLQGKKLPVS